MRGFAERQTVCSQGHHKWSTGVSDVEVIHSTRALLGHDMSQCSPCWCHSQVSLRTRVRAEPRLQAAAVTLLHLLRGGELQWNHRNHLSFVFERGMNGIFVEGNRRCFHRPIRGRGRAAHVFFTHLCSERTHAGDPETKKNCDLCAPFWPHVNTDKYEASMF